jgi:hypothetical protein
VDPPRSRKARACSPRWVCMRRTQATHRDCQRPSRRPQRDTPRSARNGPRTHDLHGSVRHSAPAAAGVGHPSSQDIRIAHGRRADVQ